MLLDAKLIAIYGTRSLEFDQEAEMKDGNAGKTVFRDQMRMENSVDYITEEENKIYLFFLSKFVGKTTLLLCIKMFNKGPVLLQSRLNIDDS